MRNLAPGNVLFHQGDDNKGVYVVATGLLAQRVVHGNGTDVIVALAGPGQTLGARAFLRNTPHATSAVALIPSSVCAISRQDAVRLTLDAPAAHMALVRCWLHALDRSQEALLRNSALGTRARLAALLLRFCAEQEDDGPVLIRVPLSRSDLAGILGILPESLSRLLRQLRDEGVLGVSGRHFQIASVIRLVELAGSRPAP